MIDIGIQLRSYQKATNIRMETREMCGRAAAEIERLTAERDKLRAAICWALGEAPDPSGKWFGQHMPEQKSDTRPRPWWWRKPLREIAGIGGLTYDKSRRTIVRDNHQQATREKS